ncbi:MAG: SBBP repeat-containing protein [Candidatus Thorarchaeota archaeon]
MRQIKLIMILFLLFLNYGSIFRLFTNSNVYSLEISYNDNLFISSFKDTPLLEWSLTWNGVENEIPRGIALDSFGNIYIAGSIFDESTLDTRIFLAKFNNLGHLQWNRTFDRGEQYAYDIAIDSADTVYVVGAIEDNITTYTDLLLIKYDNLGNYQSNITWGGSYSDSCIGIVLDSEDNIYLTGQYGVDDMDYDLCLVKYNTLGEYQWNRTWGETGEDVGYKLVLDSSNNIYVTGQFVTASNGADICLIKYNNLGEYQWNRTWNIGTHEYGTGIALDSSNNIYVTGYFLNGSYPNYDAVLIKWNNAGTKIWNKTWGKDHIDIILDIELDSEDQIYLTGFANYSATRQDDFWLMQYNTNGQQLYNNIWGGSKIDRFYAMTLDSANNLYITGTTENFGANKADVYLAMYSTNGQPSEENIPFGSTYLIFTIFGIAFLIVVELKRKKIQK